MHILANSDNLSISRHIHRHIQNLVVTLAHLEPWHIQYQKYSQIRGIFKTLAYSEPWCIQNLGVFRTLVYSEPWHIQNPVKHLRWGVFAKIVVIIFITSTFQKYLLIWCKVLSPKTPGGGGHEFLIHLFVDVSKEISIFGVELQPFTKYLRLTLVSMWNSALWGKFNFCFSTVFC